MKKFFNTIKKKTQGKGSYDSQEAAASGGASGGSEAGYEVREKDLPKLHKAAWTGDLSKVVQLVKKDTSTLDKENRTALHLACAKGHADIVKVLLEWHAKSNIGDSEAKTPLLKSEEGFAPLHMSVQLKRDEITRALLIAKANPDVQDNLGRTPLMIACYDGAITPIRMLLQFNAQTIIKDKKGCTAEDMANMTGQYAASQLLSDHSMKLRQSAGGSSLAGSINPRDTPRGSVGPSSASTTPRDPSLTNMLPVDNNDRVYRG